MKLYKKFTLKKAIDILKTKYPEGEIWREAKKTGYCVSYGLNSKCYQYGDRCLHKLLLNLGFTFKDLDQYLTEDNTYRVWREEYYLNRIKEIN